MLQDIPKMCADSLRNFTQKNFNIKLKATHAHELVAAYFGYQSKNAMLADTKFPISRIGEAKIVIMIPDSEIERRKNSLKDFPSDLPNIYDLGEPIYSSLFLGKHWKSPTPPFRSFQKAAKFLIENDYNFNEVFKFYRDIELHHIVSVLKDSDCITLSVVHATREKEKEDSFIGNGETIIKLPRVAGHIGFDEPQIIVGKWSGGARKRFMLRDSKLNPEAQIIH